MKFYLDLISFPNIISGVFVQIIGPLGGYPTTLKISNISILLDQIFKPKLSNGGICYPSVSDCRVVNTSYLYKQLPFVPRGYIISLISYKRQPLFEFFSCENKSLVFGGSV